MWTPPPAPVMGRSLLSPPFPPPTSQQRLHVVQVQKRFKRQIRMPRLLLCQLAQITTPMRLRQRAVGMMESQTQLSAPTAANTAATPLPTKRKGARLRVLLVRITLSWALQPATATAVAELLPSSAKEPLAEATLWAVAAPPTCQHPPSPPLAASVPQAPHRDSPTALSLATTLRSETATTRTAPAAVG